MAEDIFRPFFSSLVGKGERSDDARLVLDVVVLLFGREVVDGGFDTIGLDWVGFLRTSSTISGGRKASMSSVSSSSLLSLSSSDMGSIGSTSNGKISFGSGEDATASMNILGSRR